jgi:hypothetical protein
MRASLPAINQVYSRCVNSGLRRRRLVPPYHRTSQPSQKKYTVWGGSALPPCPHIQHRRPPGRRPAVQAGGTGCGERTDSPAGGADPVPGPPACRPCGHRPRSGQRASCTGASVSTISRSPRWARQTSSTGRRRAIRLQGAWRRCGDGPAHRPEARTHMTGDYRVARPQSGANRAAAGPWTLPGCSCWPEGLRPGRGPVRGRRAPMGRVNA